MHEQRLNRLADMLDTLPAEDFDMSQWIKRTARAPRPGVPEGPPLPGGLFGLLPARPGTPAVQPDPGCGFAGCAIGWAVTSNVFPNLEIRKYRSEDGREWREPYYLGKWGWAALDKIFHLTGEEKTGPWPKETKKKSQSAATWIFAHWAYEVMPTPREVAARVRQFISVNAESGGENVVPLHVAKSKTEAA